MERYYRADEEPVKAKTGPWGGHSAARGGSGPAGGCSSPEDVAFADRARPRAGSGRVRRAGRRRGQRGRLEGAGADGRGGPRSGAPGGRGCRQLPRPVHAGLRRVPQLGEARPTEGRRSRPRQGSRDHAQDGHRRSGGRPTRPRCTWSCARRWRTWT